MSSSVEGSSSGPLLPRSQQADFPRRIPSWRLGEHRRAAGRRIGRGLLLAAGLVTLSALTGILTWATTSIGPPPRVAVTLATTDYRANLHLPPNAFGDRGVGRFASWVTRSYSAARRQLELTGPPLELATADDFQRIQGDARAAVSLIYVSAHGIGTPRGPALLPADATDSGDAIPIANLIERLATLPESQQKILLLDCAHFTSEPTFGILLNDFGRQLEELEDAVRAVPNLVLLSSARRYQRSWIHPAAGSTNWAHSLLEAMNGEADDADQDGWIDLLEIHRRAASSSDQWAQRVCQEPQSALLLPTGAEGVRRARDLALFPAKLTPVQPQSLISPTRPEAIDRWWDIHRELASREIPPAVSAPARWRRFERLLLRFEHFELAGVRDAADELEQQLEALRTSLDEPACLDSLACRAGVLPPAIVGFNPSPELEAEARSLAKLLSELSGGEAANRWASSAGEQASEEAVAFLRRAVIKDRLRRLADACRAEAGVDRTTLRRAADVSAAVTDPLQPVPQCGLLLRLLARDLPSEHLESRDATQVARWLEANLRADSISRADRWWIPAAFPWLREAAEQADRERRFAGDLLFGESEARRRAEAYLGRAEKAYADCDRIFRAVASAESRRTADQAELGRLSELVDARIALSSRAESQNDVETATRLYGLLDKIDGLLESTPRSGDPRDRAIEELVRLDAEFQEHFQILAEKLNGWQAKVLTRPPDQLPNVLSALRVTGGRASQRRAAWRRLCRLAAMSGHPAGETLRRLSVGTDHRKFDASLRGELWLARWPKAVFDAIRDETSESKSQVTHRLRMLVSESGWWRSLAAAEREIERRERLARRTLASPKATAGEVAGAAFDHPLRLIRHMASVPPAESSREVRKSQSDAVVDFLTWQLHRFDRDGFWSLRQEGPPYSARVAELLTGDIAELDSSKVIPDDALLGGKGSAVDIRMPERLVWTTQPSGEVDVCVRTPQDGLSGFATLWLSGKGNIRPAQPLENQRVCRPLVEDGPDPNPVDPAAADGLMARIEKTGQASPQPSVLEVHGYFRGRRLHRRMEVQTGTEPDFHVVRNPRPSTGRIAIRQTRPARSGQGGAVTLVLDCSGSMGADRGEPFGPKTKYAQAVRAVETILDRLPSGVRLSVWAFGHAIGDDKTADPPEKAIRRIQSPIDWDAHDTELRESLVRAIRYPNLEPWNESPLLAAMLAAAEDLRGRRGVRSLVVITDGADNRIQDDHATNPLGASARDLIRQRFGDRGVTVNVIAFRVDPEKEPATRGQLSVVEELLPAGRFVTADRTSRLASEMGAMLSLEPEVELQVEASGGPAGAAQAVAIPASPARGAANWTRPLEPGLYRLSPAGERDGFAVELRGGDRLLLSRSEAGQVGLWPRLDHEFSWCPSRPCGRWTVAFAPDPGSDPQELRYNLIAEAPHLGGPLRVTRPGGLWIEARHQDQPLPVRWRPDPELAGAAWQIVVDHPSLTGRAASGRPKFQVWISDRAPAPVGALVRDRDFLKLADLAPARWHLSDGEVQLDSAAVETHAVPNRHGAVKPQPCLVLRGSGPLGDCYRLRTKGVTFEGRDEQCYTRLGQFTLRLWPVTEADAERTLQAVELISMEQFKRDALRVGGTAVLEFDNNPKADSAIDGIRTTTRRGLP